MTTWLALTRAISPALELCELTHRDRAPIDLDRARRQHEAYETALASLDCRVERLPADATMPDSVFIEDTALVFDEVAVITRPGAASRRLETAAVATALERHRRLVFIQAPATVDGGDVLTVGRQVFVGLSQRTNEAALGQIADVLGPLGYDVRPAPVSGCLHLKSAVTALDGRTLLMNPEWTDPAVFDGLRHVVVAPAEPDAANILRVGQRLLWSAEFPATLVRLRARGYAPLLVENTELAKAEGAVTCGSLVFRIAADVSSSVMF